MKILKLSTKQSTEVRTDKLNAALHVYFTLLAEELNNSGLDMRKVLKPDVNIPWDKRLVKEYLWRPIQKTVTGKKSSARITNQEATEVWEILNRHLGDKLGVHVPFPSYEHDNIPVDNL